MNTYTYKSEIIDTVSNTVLILFVQDGYKNEKITVTIKRPRYGKITNFKIYLFHTMVNTFYGTLDWYTECREQLLSVMTQEEIRQTFLKPIDKLQAGIMPAIKSSCFICNYNNELLNHDSTIGYFFIITGIKAMIAASAFDFTNNVREWLKNDFDIYAK